MDDPVQNTARQSREGSQAHSLRRQSEGKSGATHGAVFFSWVLFSVTTAHHVISSTLFPVHSTLSRCSWGRCSLEGSGHCTWQCLQGSRSQFLMGPPCWRQLVLRMSEDQESEGLSLYFNPKWPLLFFKRLGERKCKSEYSRCCVRHGRGAWRIPH